MDFPYYGSRIDPAEFQPVSFGAIIGGMNEQILYFGPEANAQAEASHRVQANALMTQGREEPVVPPFNARGGVATVDVKGRLVSGSAGFMFFFGYTGYEDVQASLMAAVSDPSVGAIILNVNSGGGHVAGVHDLAQLVAKVDKVKPVVTYTGGDMASAALWVGVGGRRLFASETAMVGSVGVLQIHIDRTKQMEMEGVKATIIRSGDDKALANPFEPLSDPAKAAMQAQSDALYDVFHSHMADRRGVSKEVAAKNFAGGRVFVGKQALEAGLVDEVGTYEAAFRYAAKLAERSLKKPTASNTTKVRAEGASAAPTAVDNPPITPRNQNMDPQDLDALAALAGMEPTAPNMAEAEFDTTKLDELTAQATSLQEQVETLQEQLTAANASLAEASAKLATTAADLEAAQAAAAEAKPQFDAAIEIARASVRTMGPNFGVTAESVAAMSVAEVLATHKDVAEKFRAKFRLKTGGVAAASVESQPPAKPALVDPLFAARVIRHQ